MKPVFTQFIPTLKMLGYQLQTLGIKFVYYSGAMQKQKQEDSMNAFHNDPETMVMVSTSISQSNAPAITKRAITHLCEIGLNHEKRWPVAQPHCGESCHHRRPLVEQDGREASHQPRRSDGPEEGNILSTHRHKAQHG